MKQLTAILPYLALLCGIVYFIPENDTGKTVHHLMPSKITVYSGGTVAKEFESIDEPKQWGNATAWYVIDAETKKRMIVSGTIVMEQK